MKLKSEKPIAIAFLVVGGLLVLVGFGKLKSE